MTLARFSRVALLPLWLLVVLAPGCMPPPATNTGSNPNEPYNPGNGITNPPPPTPEGDWGPIPQQLRGPGELPSSEFRPTFRLRNDGPDRTETIRVSVPFPWGANVNPQSWTVEGRDVDWLVLQRWPDDTVRVAQAQWTQTLPAATDQILTVVPRVARAQGAFAPHPVFAGGLPLIGAEVKDTFGVPYRYVLDGAGETLQSTSLVRTRRIRGYHRAAAGVGIGRDYLSSTFYVTEFREQPVVVVDWLLGNDYLGADFPNGSTDPNKYPLGSIDVTSAAFLTQGADLVVPYIPNLALISSPEPGPDGIASYNVLRDDYLADGQMLRYRFLLSRDVPGAPAPEQAAARATAQAMMDQPLRPVATLETYRATAAMGLLGGGQSPASDAAVRADLSYQSWINTPGFWGPWGSRGDPLATGQTGTPRNGPLSLEMLNAIQISDPRLLFVLEQKAWIQSARPLHLNSLRVTTDNDLFLWDGVPMYPGGRDLSYNSLGRRKLVRGPDPYAAYRSRIPTGPSAALQRAHGFEHYDVEHWTSDLVFDYYTTSGDAWAKDEMRQLGESLRGTVRPSYYFSATMLPARAEGWIMQGLVQCFVATGDIRYRNFALDRLHNIIERDRPRNHPSGAMYIAADEVRTGFPMPHKYYTPWQHSAVLYGYLAGYKYFGDSMFLDRCKDVVRCVDYAWVRNYPDPNPNLGLVANGLRYYAPVEYQGQPALPSVFDPVVGVIWGDGPLGGAHQELLGGMFLLSSMPELADNEFIRSRAEEYATLLLRLPLADTDYADKWFCNMPARFYR
jgi:hypothetical protein